MYSVARQTAQSLTTWQDSLWRQSPASHVVGSADQASSLQRTDSEFQREREVSTLTLEHSGATIRPFRPDDITFGTHFFTTQPSSREYNHTEPPVTNTFNDTQNSPELQTANLHVRCPSQVAEILHLYPNSQHLQNEQKNRRQWKVFFYCLVWIFLFAILALGGVTVYYIIGSTPALVPSKTAASLHLADRQYQPELSNTSSPQFKDMETRSCDLARTLVSRSEIRHSLSGCRVTAFRLAMPGLTEDKRKKLLRERCVTKTCVTAACLFVCAHLPFIILGNLVGRTPVSSPQFPTLLKVFYFSGLFVHANNLLHPLVYCTKIPDFRKAYRNFCLGTRVTAGPQDSSRDSRSQGYRTSSV